MPSDKRNVFVIFNRVLLEIYTDSEREIAFVVSLRTDDNCGQITFGRSLKINNIGFYVFESRSYSYIYAEFASPVESVADRRREISATAIAEAIS